MHPLREVEYHLANKEIAVKKYVVKLSAEERERLEALIHAGKSSAQMLTRARDAVVAAQRSALELLRA
jgi:hypothetical protein